MIPTDTTPEPTPEPKASKAAGVFDAPADVPAERSTGYAVYDTTLGQYVGGVTKEKPSAADAKAAVRKGHTYRTVRV